MNKAFNKLSDLEQKNILDCAYQVFTDTPYKQASTNKIIEMAGISKGLLFYYFQNKKKLFKYLIDHGLKYVKSEYLDKLDFKERDFLKRYVKISEIKHNAYNREPHIFAFISYVYLNEQDNIEQEQLSLMNQYTKYTTENQFKDIDTSLFRSDLPAKRVIELITYSIEGYQKILIDTFKQLEIKNESMDKYYEDYEQFIDDLRKVYYK